MKDQKHKYERKGWENKKLIRMQRQMISSGGRQQNPVSAKMSILQKVQVHLQEATLGFTYTGPVCRAVSYYNNKRLLIQLYVSST